jgi:hypothetical protein
MEDTFLDAHRSIDVDALVVGIRERVEQRQAMLDQQSATLMQKGEGSESEVGRALAAQAELNQLMVGVLGTVEHCLDRMQEQVQALQRRIDILERFGAPADGGSNGRSMRSSAEVAAAPRAQSTGTVDDRQSARDLEMLRVSLQTSLARVETLIAERTGRDR